MKKAVFIDKDGTLIRDVPYNCDPARIVFNPGVPQALKQLKSHGYQLIVVSNQSGIAMGYFKVGQLEGVVHKIQSDLKAAGVEIDAFYFCPHHPDGKIRRYARTCRCRKPEPGMLLRAAEQWHIDLSRSWMIGDILNDVEAGNRAGCRTILLDVGNETEWIMNEYRCATARVSTMPEAAALILEKENVYAEQSA